MLKRFEVSNYKNFKDSLVVDFSKVGGYQFNPDCITNNHISKMLIYGRNATGKTNLGKAILDIRKILMGPSFLFDEQIINANSFLECASFSYVFQFEEDTVQYEYSKFSSNKLCHEKLLINGNLVYSCDFEKEEYYFDNLELIKAETINTERYFKAVMEDHEEYDHTEMSLPFLRWLINNTAMEQNSVLLKLADFVSQMAAMGTGFGIGVNSAFSRSRRIKDVFVETLEDPEALNDFESFLNVMGVECKLKVQRLPDGKPELYFDHLKPLPFFENASSGTTALVQIYRVISSKRKLALLYFDEFDAFYNYEMSENLLRYFKYYYKSCQVIMTSHNTNLMTNRYMRPDCLFILSTDGRLTPLNEATNRELREGHNLEKMYISGEFQRYE